MNPSSPHPSATAPLVSVVIPTCNRRSVLQRCVEALVGQTYPNYEVIVVDDGSTDDTPDFLERFIADHPDLEMQCLRNDPNIGANPSRNRGIRQAGGGVVAFLDDDCVAEPDWLEHLIREFSSDRVAAVVGGVNSISPTNIFELTLKGTQRVPGPGPANRLVGCNMAVRRELLLRYALDEDRSTSATKSGKPVDMTVSGRGDEEGLYLKLKTAGYQQLAVPGAVVLHQHHYTGRSMFKQAHRGGRSAARLVYKFHLPPRLDLLPFMLTYLTMPLVLIHHWFAAVPVFFFAGALAAITYNDLFRKGKTIAETIRSFPVLLAYYHVRLVGYVLEAVSLRVRRHGITRERLATGFSKSPDGTES